MARTGFILILTGDETRGEQLRDALRERFGHSVHVVGRLEDALDSIRARQPDVIVADAQIDGAATLQPIGDTLEFLARDAAFVVVGAKRGRARARGVRVSLIPPERPPAEAAALIDAAAQLAVQRREERLFQESLQDQKIEAFEGIIGARRRSGIVERIRKAAPTKLTVLILGETGTGKELIARAIHSHSPRARRPFKAINCAGLSETLLESELFGHVRGAFTGAISDRKGYFMAADGGTLFLDEIGDMPLAMQPKLLRALDDREIVPVGSTDVRKVDVRVVAATNAELRKLVEERKFREDLYYRLHSFEIRVPPLRERRADIPLLAMHVLARANREHGLSVEGFSSDAMQLLARYFWPGNIRELANVIESVCVDVGKRRIEAEDLPEQVRGSRELVPIAGGALAGLTMEQIERMAIEWALKSTGGNREQAAKQLNIGTRTLYRKIKEYGL